MTANESIPGIVEDLYAGTLDDAAWERALIALTDLVGASNTHLLSQNTSQGIVLRDEPYRLDPALAADYRAYWCTRDILLEPVLRLPVGEPTPDYQLAPQVWEKSEIFNDLAVPHNLPHVLITLLHKSDEKIVSLSMKASERHGPFQSNEIRRLRALIPHVSRALEIKDRLAHSRVRADTVAKTFDSLTFGVIFLDARGRVVEASAIAWEYMRSPKSGIGRDRTGKLSLRGPAEAELMQWISTGMPALKRADGLLHILRNDMLPLSVLVTPLPHKSTQSWITGDPCWMLLVFDPERQVHASVEVISRDLGLSVREAEVATLLCAGYELNAIAERMAISIHTVRTHLKAIFAKTGIRSQVELIKRIANGPAYIGKAVR